MENLLLKKCIPCEGGIAPMNPDQARVYMAQALGWLLSSDIQNISKHYQFKNFKEAMVFANKVGDLAESEGHHPDMTVSWGKVGIYLTTHAIKGLSENDFILAAKIDLLAL